MKNSILFLCGYLCLVCENVFSKWTDTNLQSGSGIFVLHLLIIFLVFLTIYGDEKISFFYSIVFGLIVDIVNSGVIGIYVMILPIAIWFCGKIKYRFENKTLLVTILALSTVMVIEMLVYSVYTLIGKTEMNMVPFLGYRLLPTILLNALVLLIMWLPLRKLTRLSGQGITNPKLKLGGFSRRKK